MIVLGANIFSEMMRPAPHPNVTAWLNAQAAETVYLSSVTLAERLFGVAALPEGRRRDVLARTLQGMVALFKGRILPFDADAARRFPELAVRAGTAGRGLPTPDGYIAAIAASRGFAVASRDTSPFQAAGVAVVNPWELGART